MVLDVGKRLWNEGWQRNDLSFMQRIWALDWNSESHELMPKGKDKWGSIKFVLADNENAQACIT